ncbi:DNA-3-methyladenine glycosylase, partial [Paenibacillus sp. TAF43_2]
MQTIQTKLYDYGQAEIDYLKNVDEALGAAMSRLGKVERIIMPDLFTSLVYAIVGQLISAKAVHTIWERMQVRLGEITPLNIANQTADQIQSCGITMKKAICIKSIAESIIHGEIRLEELNRLSDAEVIKQLMSLKGVGKWTAEMLLIHAMERPDVVSWGDIAIRRGMMKLYGLQDLTKEQFDTYRLR